VWFPSPVVPSKAIVFPFGAQLIEWIELSDEVGRVISVRVFLPPALASSIFV
jgi:hypothetical protein